MDEERPPDDKAIVPVDTDRQLSLPLEIVNRGLDIAAKLESRRNIQKYTKPIRTFSITKSPGLIDFSRNGNIVAILDVGLNPELHIMDIESGDILTLSSREQGFTNLGQDGAVWSMAISNNGAYAVVGYDDADVLCWDIKNIHALSRVTGSLFLEPAGCLDFFPDDTCYAVYGFYDHLNVHDIGSAEYVCGIKCHLNTVYALAFTDDGRRLLIGGFPGMNSAGLLFEDVEKRIKSSLELHDKKAGLIFKTSEGKTIHAVAIFPDNNKVLSLDNNSVITVWDGVSGEEVLHWYHAESSLEGNMIYRDGSISISPDGRRILSAGSDNYMRLWTPDGHQICEYPHDSKVLKVVFSSDRRHAVSACAEVVSVWELPV